MRGSVYLISGPQCSITLPCGSLLTTKSSFASIAWAFIMPCIPPTRKIPPSKIQPSGTCRSQACSRGSDWRRKRIEFSGVVFLAISWLEINKSVAQYGQLMRLLAGVICSFPPHIGQIKGVNSVMASSGGFPQQITDINGRLVLIRICINYSDHPHPCNCESLNFR